MAIAKVGSCEPSVKTDAGRWGKTGKMKKPATITGTRRALAGVGILMRSWAETTKSGVLPGLGCFGEWDCEWCLCGTSLAVWNHPRLILT